MYGITRESSYNSRSVYFFNVWYFQWYFYIFYVNLGSQVIAIDTVCSVHMSDEAYLTINVTSETRSKPE